MIISQSAPILSHLDVMRFLDRKCHPDVLSLLKLGSKDTCNDDPLNSVDYSLFDGLNT